MARLCEADLLTVEEERVLFRRMNYLKYRANALRTKIDPRRPDAEALNKIEAFLHDAEKVRDCIVRSNLRLAVSAAKRFTNQQVRFEDLLSDGIIVLMDAVIKFDYDRGFRFSTYAYRSIARQAYRTVNRRHQQNARVRALDEESASCQKSTVSMDDRTWGILRGLLAKMLRKLNCRERLIIRARYALGREHHVRTFQDLANELGVSKERVRQLESRAVKKFQEAAASLPVDDLLPSYAAQDEQVD